MDTLYRRQCHSKRRCLIGKQSAAGIAFHDSDTHLILFAYPVKVFPFRVYAVEGFIILFFKIVIDVLAGRKQIKSRVYAEQYHFYDIALRRQLGHLRIVGAHADMTDHPILL